MDRIWPTSISISTTIYLHPW